MTDTKRKTTMAGVARERDNNEEGDGRKSEVMSIHLDGPLRRETATGATWAGAAG